jgi:glutamate synthase (NADPH/NADH) large chain
VLGETGKNFAAGMSGGVAYVLDESGEFERRTNTGMVTLSRELGERDERMLRRLIENHAAYTDSERAREILENWEEYVERFVKVMPDAYHEVITERDAEDVRDFPPAPADTTDAVTTYGASAD